MSPFPSFRKIPRLMKPMVVSEKIDGTNSLLVVAEGGVAGPETALSSAPVLAEVGSRLLFAGSRNRWITPDSDNFGFARWVRDNADALATLKPGFHYGEWWGLGIQRGYGLKEKRFSLFHYDGDLPEIVHRVPVLFKGPFDTQIIDMIFDDFRTRGSTAAPGYMNPEGIVVYHEAAGQLFKRTYEGDKK